MGIKFKHAFIIAIVPVSCLLIFWFIIIPLKGKNIQNKPNQNRFNVIVEIHNSRGYALVTDIKTGSQYLSTNGGIIKLDTKGELSSNSSAKNVKRNSVIQTKRKEPVVAVKLKDGSK